MRAGRAVGICPANGGVECSAGGREVSVLRALMRSEFGGHASDIDLHFVFALEMVQALVEQYKRKAS